jgi:flagellin
VTDIGSMTIQIGANQYQTMDIRIPETSSKSLYLDTINVAEYQGAENAMLTLDDAISTVSATRSRIGAFQNRLEYASNSLAESNEDMTSAYSTLLDTDMAEEMTTYTQATVLEQASISVLSQANDIPQTVLSLLQ